ncbi:MAG: hypothetical protein LUD81_11080, partial [Clostridiales bacterium]|nr:hypothetical protein [Clostridiales bacterium]
MIFSRDYSRAILNLKQEESSSSDRFGIFGRIVIEIKAGKGEIMLYAKGIEGGRTGSLYLICQRGERLIPLKAVLVNINEGSAALKWRFNPDNISGSSLKIEDVRVITVITKEGRPLLSAYCGRPLKWRASEVFSSEIHRGEAGAGEIKKPEIKTAESKPKAENKTKEKTGKKPETEKAAEKIPEKEKQEAKSELDE